MRIDILTLFPTMFSSPFGESMIHRAREKGLLDLNIINMRDFAENRQQQADDYPYGGGPGMVIKADVAGKAIESCRTSESRVIYLSPRGKVLNQTMVEELAGYNHMVLLCGHYEGIDERVMSLVHEEISIGDYILTGGELPAMVLVDAVARMIPGVLGDEQSSREESFSSGLLEYPQYTRPPLYKEMEVPPILLSGHHENIRRWRKQQSLLQTLLKRPDLLLEREFDGEEKELLEEILFCRGRVDN